MQYRWKRSFPSHVAVSVYSIYGALISNVEIKLQAHLNVRVNIFVSELYLAMESVAMAMMAVVVVAAAAAVAAAMVVVVRAWTNNYIPHSMWKYLFLHALISQGHH